MIHAGTEALAAMSPARDDPNAALLPNLYQMRHVSVKVAVAVANAARKEGLVGERAIEERDGDHEFTEVRGASGAFSKPRLIWRGRRPR